MRVGVNLRHFVFVCARVCEEGERVNVFQSAHLCVNGNVCVRECLALCVCPCISILNGGREEGDGL